METAASVLAAIRGGTWPIRATPADACVKLKGPDRGNCQRWFHVKCALPLITHAVDST